MQAWWTTLDTRARWQLGAGALAIGLVLALAGWWAWRTPQAVLFSGLSVQDAGVLAAELDRQKVPYQVGADGTSLLVDQAQVHATRLRLMARDLPLHGGVGFELFNTSEFGVSEFAQKINYQRALQGELARTLLSFPEVRQARVHLAMPEQGLFRAASAAPKAAVSLALRPGHALQPPQVQGIQRLVAAAVPGLALHDVTVVDERGMALSRAALAAGDGGGGLLDLKRDTEHYLARKADLVLERAFGAGQASASVDVLLAADQVRTTIEDVLPAPAAAGAQAATGVLVRERESLRDTPLGEARPGERPGRGSSSQRDAEYQAGRRVEQVVSQPGAIRRLHVVAIVRRPLDSSQRDQVRQLVGTAVGWSAERGDVVWVHAGDPQAVAAGTAAAASDADAAHAGLPPEVHAANSGPGVGWAAGVLALCVLASAAAAARWQRRRVVPRLDEAQRLLALGRVQAWLDQPATARPQAGERA